MSSGFITCWPQRLLLFQLSIPTHSTAYFYTLHQMPLLFLIETSTIDIFKLGEKEKSNSDHQHNNIQAIPELSKKLKVAMWCMT